MYDFILYVNMFGEFSIYTEKNKVTKKGNRSKKLWLLLALLIINKGRGISREILIEYLWHDTDKCIDPVNSLKNLVYRTRIFLNDLVQNEKVDFIDFYNDAYIWNMDIKCIIDVEQMELYLKKAFFENNADEKINYYYKAVNLYKGQFLENIDEGEWIFAKRSYYESIYVKGVLDLCEVLMKQDRIKDVILLCEQSLINCPYQEDFHKILLECYIKINQYSKALVHYKNFTTSFSNEFGLGVSKEIHELYQKIIKNVQGLESNLNIIKKDLIMKREKQAFLCEMPIFQQIINFQMNFKFNRYKSNQFQILVLLTVVNKYKEIPEVSKLKNVMAILRSSILKMSRSNDIVSRYSPNQYILALIVSSTFEIKKFVERIENNFNSHYKSDDINIDYQYVKFKE